MATSLDSRIQQPRHPEARRPCIARFGLHILTPLLLALGGCQQRPASTAEAQADAPGDAQRLPPDAITSEDAALRWPSFEQYWYQGKAELNRYQLKQSRYGELHDGDAVLIFVTEDFLRDKQVKHEFGPGDQSTPVLKLNAYRRFYTGLYPYNLLTSIFSPVKPDLEAPLKVSFGAQEWCGQTFSQLNRREGMTESRFYSYFQSEGDSTTELAADVLLEDGLWNWLRRDPDTLPTGTLQIVPGLHHARLRHAPLAATTATLTLVDEGTSLRRYEIRYEAGRSLTIRFERAFPHRVLSWQEDPGGGLPTTNAVLTRSLLLDYWARNNRNDATYRDALGLQW